MISMHGLMPASKPPFIQCLYNIVRFLYSALSLRLLLFALDTLVNGGGAAAVVASLFYAIVTFFSQLKYVTVVYG